MATKKKPATKAVEAMKKYLGPKLPEGDIPHSSLVDTTPTQPLPPEPVIPERYLAEEPVHLYMDAQYLHKEMMAAAFMKKTGLDPEQVELVEERQPRMIRWYYRKRE